MDFTFNSYTFEVRLLKQATGGFLPPVACFIAFSECLSFGNSHPLLRQLHKLSQKHLGQAHE